MSDDKSRRVAPDPPDRSDASTTPAPDITGALAGIVSEGVAERGGATRAVEAAGRPASTRTPQRIDGDKEPRTSGSVAGAAVGRRAFAALADNRRDYAIFLMDRDGIITFWGEGARLMKRWSREQVEGAHLRFLYPDGGAEDGTADGHLQHAAEKGEYTGEGTRMSGDGSTFWCGTTLTALRDDQGRLLGFAKVTRDLSARRAADAALKAAHRATEEASQAKSMFLATVSHEIRTPLNAIMAYTDLLEMELAGPLTEQQRNQLGRIAASSRHLLGIVDHVLDFSRLEAGHIAIEHSAVPLGRVVTTALSVVRPEAQTRGVEIADAVAGTAEDLWCQADEDRVKQVLINLLANAIKFTEPGGRITVSAGTAEQVVPDAEVEGPGPWVYVRVEDTGIGIPAQRLEAVFGAFEQVEMSHTREHGGAGLGLPVSRGLARRMRGEVTVRSDPAAGSTFCLWLPAAPTAAIETPQRAEESTEGPGAGLLQEIGSALMADLERVLFSLVARLRGDPAVPSARRVSERELEDHLAPFLSDVARTLARVDVSDGADAGLLNDSTPTQRTLAEGHGKQRFRLGWREFEIHREFEILREELAASIRRRVPSDREAVVEDAAGVLGEFVARAEKISVAGFRAAQIQDA